MMTLTPTKCQDVNIHLMSVEERRMAIAREFVNFMDRVDRQASNQDNNQEPGNTVDPQDTTQGADSDDPEDDGDEVCALM